MDYWSLITNTYPELKDDKEIFLLSGQIVLEDDGDGIQYLSKWEYSKPIPDGLKLGK